MPAEAVWITTGLAAKGAGETRESQSIYSVLEDTGNGIIVFRCDEGNAIRISYFGSNFEDLGRKPLSLEIRVIVRDGFEPTDDGELHAIRSKFRQ
jgi:hypothetical protein